jgi:hypothetical protein
VLDDCYLKFIDVLELWRNSNAVCFDVDSTVFQIVNYHIRSTTEDEEQNVFGENLRIAFIT